jgi:ankyrin repeat protein
VLLDHESNPNPANRKGETPLIVAVEKGSVELAKLLLAKGADPNMKDRSGASALSLAKDKGNKAMLDALSAAR